MRRVALIFACLGLLAATQCRSCAANDDAWLGFRGDGTSVASGASPPATWSVETGENVAWTTELPGRGVSGPIVVDGSVFVTSSSGPRRDRLHICAIDVESGDKIWERKFWATGRTLVHPMSAVAANTPVSDGRRVFAFFSSNDLIAVDLQGNVQWMRGLQESYPAAGNDVGLSSSPVVVGNAVVVQCEAQGEGFAAAFNAEDGDLLWRVERPHEPNWSSPVALQQEVDGETVDAVLLQSATRVDVLRADDGAELWSKEIACSSIPSPVFAGQLFLPARGLSAFSTGPPEAGAQSWAQLTMKPANASPVVFDGKAYVINSAGVLACATVGYDSVAYRKRLGGKFWATPVVAGGRLYCINSEGNAYVVELDTDGESVQESSFEEEIYASPAVAGEALYVRSYSRLWKIAD